MPLELYSKEEIEAAKVEKSAAKEGKTETKGGKSKKSIITESLKGTGTFINRFKNRFGGEAIGVAIGLPVSGYFGKLVENALVSDKSSITNNVLGWGINSGTKIAGYFILKKIKERMNPAGITENVIDGLHVAMAGSIVLDTTLRLSGCNNRSLLALNKIQKLSNEPPILPPRLPGSNNIVSTRYPSKELPLPNSSTTWVPLTQQQIQEINRKIST